MVLVVPGEADIALLADKLDAAGVPHVRVEEPDAPWLGALMAIGLVPGRKEVLRRHVSSLPLLR